MLRPAATRRVSFFHHGVLGKSITAGQGVGRSTFFAVGCRFEPTANESGCDLGYIKMCSESKKKCIYAVSKELGVEVDWQGLGELSDEQASSRIDDLKRQLNDSNGAFEKSPLSAEPKINDPRFGMCFKLVYGSAPPSYWAKHNEVFKREVVSAYKLAEETEAAVKSAASCQSGSLQTDQAMAAGCQK